MKKCPYCAEEIHSEAIKCKYCQSMLGAVDKVENNSESFEQKIANEDHKEPKEKSSWKKFFEIIIGLIVAHAFINLALFFIGGTINIVAIPIWIIACIIAYKLGMFRLEGSFGIGKKGK